MSDSVKKPIILLAEDSELSARIAIRTLEKAGYDVVHALNGRDAYEMAADLQPDLILMDVMMPQMDGLMSLRMIRTNKTLANTPVVMLTALQDAIERCMSTGATACVEKADLHDSLLKTVKQYAPLQEGASA